MTAPDRKRMKRGDLKAAVMALADGTMSTAQIAEKIGTTPASVNGVIQRYKLNGKIRHGIRSPRRRAAEIREAALREAAAAAEAALNVPCAKCGVARAQHHHRHPFVPSGVTDPVAAILALIPKGAADV